MGAVGKDCDLVASKQEGSSSCRNVTKWLPDLTFSSWATVPAVLLAYDGIDRLGKHLVTFLDEGHTPDKLSGAV